MPVPVRQHVYTAILNWLQAALSYTSELACVCSKILVSTAYAICKWAPSQITGQEVDPTVMPHSGLVVEKVQIPKFVYTLYTPKYEQSPPMKI